MIVRLSNAEGTVLLTLARAAIEDELFAGQSLASARTMLEITPALAVPRAFFVTLESLGEDGALRLRGCVGSTEARLPAHEAVVASARSAAFSDPRFSPLTREEYPAVLVSVSVLTPLLPVPTAEAIVLGRHGVVLECDGRTSVFLPEVAPKCGWTRIELLEQLAGKAGLPIAAWRRAKLFTFESEHFAEDPRRGC